MADEIYLAGDFSGIQRFVLRVKTAGKAQAKRLRARSFVLQLLEHAALSILRTRFALQERDVLVQGGGGFLVRFRAAIDDIEFDRLATDLQDRLWEQCGGQMHVSLGWAATPTEARAEMERRKLMPSAGVLQREGAWDRERLSRPPLGEPCTVCGDWGAASFEMLGCHAQNAQAAQKIPRDFQKFIDDNVDWVTSSADPKTAFLKGFLPHFEALVGFGAAHLKSGA